MKLSTLKPWSVVILGRKDEVGRGVGGIPAFFIARGNYTLAPQPCGDFVVQESKHARTQAVIALQTEGLRRYMRMTNMWGTRLPEDEQALSPYVVGPGMIRMTFEEYELKAAGIREEQAMVDQWRQQGKLLREEAFIAMQDFLPPCSRQYDGAVLLNMTDIATWLEAKKVKKATAAAKAIRTYMKHTESDVCRRYR